jgi:hypothetical protein
MQMPISAIADGPWAIRVATNQSIDLEMVLSRPPPELKRSRVHGVVSFCFKAIGAVTSVAFFVPRSW